MRLLAMVLLFSCIVDTIIPVIKLIKNRKLLEKVKISKRLIKLSGGLIITEVLNCLGIVFFLMYLIQK